MRKSMSTLLRRWKSIRSMATQRVRPNKTARMYAHSEKVHLGMMYMGKR